MLNIPYHYDLFECISLGVFFYSRLLEIYYEEPESPLADTGPSN